MHLKVIYFIFDYKKWMTKCDFSWASNSKKLMDEKKLNFL